MPDFSSIKQLTLALITGIACGAVFSIAKLPLPAPPHIAGIVGILGVFLGYKIVMWLGT